MHYEAGRHKQRVVVEISTRCLPGLKNLSRRISHTWCSQLSLIIQPLCKRLHSIAPGLTSLYGFSVPPISCPRRYSLVSLTTRFGRVFCSFWLLTLASMLTTSLASPPSVLVAHCRWLFLSYTAPLRTANCILVSTLTNPVLARGLLISPCAPF